MARIAGCGVIAALFLTAIAASAQLPSSTSDYHLALPVDEVSLTFHASDAHGLSVNDLTASDLVVLDNDKPPRRIIAFRRMQSDALRAGLLIDTSPSMDTHLAQARTVASAFAQQLLRQQTDQAFVMDFGYTSNLRQPFTGNAAALSASIAQVSAGRSNPLAGTALFDALFRACFNVFGKPGAGAAETGNFILLFTDGEDNASHVTLQEAATQCQHSNVAIYAFRAEPKAGDASTGPETLARLTHLTGGTAFSDDESAATIDADLRSVESGMRSQYLLDYAPAALWHDGTFHRVTLAAPARAASIAVRSGYYAPAP